MPSDTPPPSTPPHQPPTPRTDWRIGLPEHPEPAPQSFLDACTAYGLELEPAELDALAQYLSLLLHANKSFNLTAITDPAEAWLKHIFDSLTVLPILADLIEPNPHPSIIDVGSGGGLPGIPLAITMPDFRFTLLEPTGKKADFLRECIDRLKLRNARVIQGRAESLAQDHREHREKYDAAVARAVGHLAIIAELTTAFVRVRGRVALIKGQRADEELDEARAALTMLHSPHAGTVDTPTGRIVVLDRGSCVPRPYPRRDGEPKRAPLGLSRPRKDRDE